MARRQTSAGRFASLRRAVAVGAMIGLICASLSTVAGAEEPTTRARRVRGYVSGAPISVAASPVPGGWLDAFNYYRAMASLPPVTENPAWSADAAKHAKYMVKTGTIEHEEDPASRWYTPEGDTSARNSNILVSSEFDQTQRESIEGWITAPFHAIGMLDPHLTTSGFGEYNERGRAFEYGAAVDVLRGLGPNPAPGATFPVMWPGPDSTVYLDRYPGNETPDPLASDQCSAFQPPTGLPIYLMLDAHSDLTSTHFRQGTQTDDLAHCAYDFDEYWFSDGSAVMASRNAIFLIPKKPLPSEKRFHVEIETADDTYNWSFRTGDTKAPRTKITKPAMRETYDQDRLEKIVGTASRDAERVNVAVARHINGTLKCRFLKEDGSFTDKRPCYRDIPWAKARGKSDWSWRLPRKLPPSVRRGEYSAYLAFSQATDEVGNVEPTPPQTNKFTLFTVDP